MRVGIIGTGLIGASIGLACRERGDTVLGCDRDPGNLEYARLSGAIDAAASGGELYDHCDTIVIALPLEATIDELRALEDRAFRPEQLVIDVASVKAPVESAGRAHDAFVPTHPMAGAQTSGPREARAELFVDRSWCYVATRDARRTQLAKAFIERLGAHAFCIEAEEHDRIVAITSHLPQLFAFAFKRVLDAFQPSMPAGVTPLCGPVALELLRIANSSPQMWDPIFQLNGRAIQEALARIEQEIRRLA